MAAAGRCARPLQLTLALLKPDAVAHPLVLEVRAGGAGPPAPGRLARLARPSAAPLPALQAVHEVILSNRFLIVRAKELRCGREESGRFYREHAGRRPAGGSRLRGRRAWALGRAA